MPPGITPRRTSVPTSAAAACIVVPSPPKTTTVVDPLRHPVLGQPARVARARR